MSSRHEIVILGANFGGISVAHYVLKQTIPALKALDPSRSYHVTLVGPSTFFYHKISAPRALVGGNLISTDQNILSLSEGFSKYSATEYTFVQGLATGLDHDSKTVTVTHGDTSTALTYNSLVVATGTTANPMWTINDDITATRSEYAYLHAALPKAKTVLIAGGGPVGVESAGEIASQYPDADITLLSGGDRLLPRLSNGTSSRAEKMLKGHGVHVEHKRRVVSVDSPEDRSATHLKFDNGSDKTVDVYLDATGGKPNTSFLPSTWLDTSGRVITNQQSCRAQADGVYCIGDASNTSLGGVIDVGLSWGPLCSSMGQDIAAAIKAPSKAPAFRERKFKPMAGTQFVPIGRKGGVGQIMGWRMPSFVVWFLKGRTFFIEQAKPTVLGADAEKA